MTQLELDTQRTLNILGENPVVISKPHNTGFKVFKSPKQGNYQTLVKSTNPAKNRHVKTLRLQKSLKGKTLIIESSDKNDTTVDIEDTLVKAVSMIKTKRENKKFEDRYLLDRKDESTRLVNKIFSNMLEEIIDIIQK